jgi:hypothetical protein
MTVLATSAALLLVACWPAGARPQAPDAGAAPPGSADQQQRAPEPWLAPGGSAPAPTSVESAAAAVAAQEGLGPQAVPMMVLFYRPRQIAAAPSAQGGYVFTAGEARKVISENTFLDSYLALTGSNDLERYRVVRPRPGAGPAAEPGPRGGCC